MSTSDSECDYYHSSKPYFWPELFVYRRKVLGIGMVLCNFAILKINSKLPKNMLVIQDRCASTPFGLGYALFTK
jgi:hypothetical protein